MSKNIVRLACPILAVIAAILASGCAIAFDVTTQKTTIQLPNSGGMYIETAIDIPENARQGNISFSEITLYYTIRKNGSVAARVALYTSTDQTADANKNGADEKLLDVSLGISDTEVSGSVISEKIKEALNNRQARFVIGAENLSLNPLAQISIDLKVQFKGDFSLF